MPREDREKRAGEITHSLRPLFSFLLLLLRLLSLLATIRARHRTLQLFLRFLQQTKSNQLTSSSFSPRAHHTNYPNSLTLRLSVCSACQVASASTRDRTRPRGDSVISVGTKKTRLDSSRRRQCRGADTRRRKRRGQT